MKISNSWKVCAACALVAAGRVMGADDMENLKKLTGFVAAAEFHNSAGGGEKMFEFSGLAVAGSRIYVVDNESDQLGQNGAGISDEKKQAFFEVVLEKNGVIHLRRAFAEGFAPHGKDANDIEALAMLDGDLYAIGSHSLKNDGTYKTDRHVLLRIPNPATGEPKQIDLSTKLSAALVDLAEKSIPSFTVIEKAGKKKQTSKTIDGLNIEGLTAVPGVEGLLLGLRGPVVDGKAYVLQLLNPAEIFAGAKPKLSLFVKLDLGGNGISMLDYDEQTKSLLVGASGKEVTGQQQRTHLWQWKFPLKDNAPKKVMSFDGHKLEGLCRIPAGMPHAGKLLLAFDEEDPANDKIQFGRLVIMGWPN